MKEIEDRATLREAFGRIVAHELRTPVTTIYGGAQLIADPSVSEETRLEAARSVAAEAERLYRTVEDLVVLARIDELTDLDDAPILLQRFLANVLRAEEPRFSSARFVADVPGDLPAVAGRQGYVEQVVRHLLVGAARLNPPNGLVRLIARARARDVEVRVVADGPPITADEARMMFDLFARLPHTAADASGANLGLFVARRIIEAMGGTIHARPTRRPTLAFRLRIFPDDGG